MIRRTLVDDSGLLATVLSTLAGFVFAAAALLVWLPLLRFSGTAAAFAFCAVLSAACFAYRRGAMARRGKARATIEISGRIFRPGEVVRASVLYQGTPSPRRFDVLAGMSGYVFRESETRVAERRETLDWREPYAPRELSFQWTLPTSADPKLDWSIWVTTEGGESWLELHENVRVG